MSSRLLSRRAALVLVVLLVLSPALGAVAPAVADHADMGSVPDSNIQSNLPPQAQVPISVQDLRGSVMASSHASSLEVTLTTPSRAPGGVPAAGSSDFALVFSDASNHEGRQVAVPKQAIADALGYVPKVAYGVHEDGSRWTRPIKQESGLLIFRIPKFSSNTVTFSGTVQIKAQPATDGSSWTYDVGNPDSVTDPNVTLTGVLNSEWDNVTASGISPGHSQSVALSGNLPIVGPGANGRPTVSVTGHRANESEFTTSDGTDYLAYDIGSGVNRGEVYYSSPPGTIQTINISFYGPDSQNVGGLNFDIYAIEERPDGTYSEGTLVASNVQANVSGTWANITLETAYEVAGTSGVTFEFVPLSDSTDEWIVVNYTNKASGVWGSYAGTTDSWARSVYIQSTPSDVNITADDGSSVVIGSLSDGQTVTKEFNISRSATQVNVTGSGGSLDYTIHLKERTETVDPSVELNDHWMNYTGTLSDGQQVNLTGNSSWIQDGKNRVNLTMDDSGLSADAPAMQVDLLVEHEAEEKYSTKYHSDAFAESYNVSHLFPAREVGATLEVPFSANVYRLQYLEWSINDSAWSSVPSGRYSWNGDTLVVDLKDGDTDGDVDAGTKVEVRVRGIMVKTVNGTISVPEPMDPDASKIDTKIKVESTSSGFHIVVRNGSRLHYAYQESWSNVNDHTVIESDGRQKLYLPSADAGDTAWVTVVPVEVIPKTGDVWVRVRDVDGPTIEVKPGPSGSGEDVRFRYYSVSDGETYELYSISRSRVLAKAEASGGVAELLEDDSEEVLEFQLASGSSDGGGGGGGAGGSWRDTAQTALGGLFQLAVPTVWALLVVLLVVATGRSGVSGRSRWALVGTAAVGGGVLSLEVLNPGTISSAVGSGLQEVVPLAGLAGIGLVLYSAYSWWTTRQKEAATPETKVTFDLGRNK